MNNKKRFFAEPCGGFTLVELLVAATIVGILAVFATTSYRSSVAETRFAQAKAMTNQLAAAVQRARIDYQNADFYSSVAMDNPPQSAECGLRLGTTSTFYPSQLIACDYLEPSGWNNSYFNFYVCDKAGKGEWPCGTTLASRPAVACMRGKAGSKLPSKYQKIGYCYYTFGAGEELTNNS